MNPEQDPKWDDLLKSWKPPIDVPPRFESEVWRRIALAQEKRSEFWSFRWLFQLTCQPKLAFAMVVVAVFLGTGVANWQAERSYHRDMAASESRYIHSVDPFANTFLTSNP